MEQALPFSIIRTASGRYGGIVYVTRGGKTHVRRYVAPRNPRTAAQQRRRGLFARAVSSWQALDGQQRALWNRRALMYGRRSASGYHLYLGAILRGETPFAAPAPPQHSSVSAPLRVRFDAVPRRMPLRERIAYARGPARAA